MPLDSRDAKAERVAGAIALALIVVGAAARVYALVGRDSLWQDEATLALNVLGRPFLDLLTPLDWAQAAAPGYLWLARASAVAFGGSEWALRLVPLVGGLAVLPLAGWAARKIAGPWAGALAVALAACSQLAVRFSVEAKPYSSDAGVAAALLCLAIAVLDAPERARRWTWLALAGLVALTMSVPAVFVAAAIGLALVVDRAVRGDPGARRRFVAVALVWAGWFGLLYALVFRQADSEYLRTYWSPVFLDPEAPNLLFRLQWVFLELTWHPFRMTYPLLGLLAGVAAWVLGLIVVARRRPAHLAILGGAPLLALAASALSRYPFSERLALFAVPGVWIAQAVALVWCLSRLGPFSRRLPATLLPTAACLTLAALGLQDAWGFLRAPAVLDPPRGLIETVRERAASEGAPVYVHARGGASWMYVTTDWRVPDLDRLARYRALSSAVDAPGFENVARTRPVAPGEAEPLVLRDGGVVELIGLGAGKQHRKIGRPQPFEPSPGWAEEEARRLRAAASPAVWLFASHYFKGTRTDELAPLLAAARSAGLEVTEEIPGGDDALALKLVAR